MAIVVLFKIAIQSGQIYAFRLFHMADHEDFVSTILMNGRAKQLSWFHIYDCTHIHTHQYNIHAHALALHRVRHHTVLSFIDCSGNCCVSQDAVLTHPASLTSILLNQL